MLRRLALTISRAASRVVAAELADTTDEKSSNKIIAVDWDPVQQILALCVKNGPRNSSILLFKHVLGDSPLRTTRLDLRAVPRAVRLLPNQSSLLALEPTKAGRTELAAYSFITRDRSVVACLPYSVATISAINNLPFVLVAGAGLTVINVATAATLTPVGCGVLLTNPVVAISWTPKTITTPYLLCRDGAVVTYTLPGGPLTETVGAWVPEPELDDEGLPMAQTSARTVGADLVYYKQHVYALGTGDDGPVLLKGACSVKTTQWEAVPLPSPGAGLGVGSGGVQVWVEDGLMEWSGKAMTKISERQEPEEMKEEVKDAKVKSPKDKSPEPAPTSTPTPAPVDTSVEGPSETPEETPEAPEQEKVEEEAEATPAPAPASPEVDPTPAPETLPGAPHALADRGGGVAGWAFVSDAALTAVPTQPDQWQAVQAAPGLSLASMLTGEPARVAIYEDDLPPPAKTWRKAVKAAQQAAASLETKLDAVFEKAERDRLLAEASAASTPAGPTAQAESGLSGAHATMAENMQKMAERGQRLGEMAEKTAQMADTASDFAALCRELAK